MPKKHQNTTNSSVKYKHKYLKIFSNNIRQNKMAFGNNTFFQNYISLKQNRSFFYQN